jgi:hypothetical protein
MPKVYAGVDIGLSGGIGVIVDGVPHVFPMEWFVVRLEVGKRKVKKGKHAGENVPKVRSEIDTAKLARHFRMLRSWGDLFVMIEKPQMRPTFIRGGKNACPACGMEKGQGAQSQANFLGQFRELRGILAGIGVPFADVHPSTWKADVFRGVGGSDKDAARMMAAQLFPSIAEKFALKKSDGIAEAILLADYGKRRRGE